MNKIALVEVFRSPQGEGYNTGRDAIFVRTAGCNLSCVFAEGAVCDTPYQQASLKLTLDELFEEHIRPLLGGKLPDEGRWYGREEMMMLVLTGGEPTMQPLFDELVRRAKRHYLYVAVESNGTKWREGLGHVDWLCVSPKTDVKQGSPAPGHNHNPQSAALHPEVVRWMAQHRSTASGEYRFVIASDSPWPEYLPAFRHYLSPAVLSDGSGLEWKTGFPGFVPGAVDRCLKIVQEDPRWRISLQTHKLLGVR